MTAAALLASADGVLVDLDMTLVDSTAAVRCVWTAFARRHSLDPDHVLATAQGRPSRETVGLFVAAAGRVSEHAAIERAEVEDTGDVRALPGAHELLESGRRLAIVTSCSTALARARLHAAGLPVPKVLVSSDGLTRGKPDPECFLIAARRLKLAPARCVVIEDAPVGIQAGRAAGAKVIALRTSHPDEQLGEAHALADDIAAILSAERGRSLQARARARSA